MIERRRAAEFAAMALAGEDDDDDDDDDTSRRGSTSKSKAAAAANGNPPPTRSLKGKETFKHRTLRPSEDRKRKREDKKQRRKSEPGEKRSFIDEIMSGGESDSEEEEKPRRRSNAGHGNGKRMSSLREADELADDVPQVSVFRCTKFIVLTLHSDVKAISRRITVRTQHARLSTIT